MNFILKSWLLLSKIISHIVMNSIMESKLLLIKFKATLWWIPLCHKILHCDSFLLLKICSHKLYIWMVLCPHELMQHVFSSHYSRKNFLSQISHLILSFMYWFHMLNLMQILKESSCTFFPHELMKCHLWNRCCGHIYCTEILFCYSIWKYVVTYSTFSDPIWQFKIVFCVNPLWTAATCLFKILHSCKNCFKYKFSHGTLKRDLNVHVTTGSKAFKIYTKDNFE